MLSYDSPGPGYEEGAQSQDYVVQVISECGAAEIKADRHDEQTGNLLHTVENSTPNACDLGDGELSGSGH